MYCFGADEAAGPTILESQVDPAVWQLELERVTPLLKVKLASDSKEWRTHLETTSKHGEVIKTLFPETKNALLKLGVELKKLTERVTLKEKAINKDFDNLSSDFRQRQVELDQLSHDYEHLNQSVMEMTNELAIKSDEIENLKNQMADRNQSITDTSPLRQIKQALANLRAEIKQMELRIGVAAQSNLQAKLKEGQRKHTK
jgi:estrogen-related receptor beta like 1